MKNDTINPILIEEAISKGGTLELDFSNPLHYEHIMNTIGINDSGSGVTQKRVLKSVLAQKVTKYGELLSVIEEQRLKDGNKERKSMRLMATNAGSEPAGKSGDRITSYNVCYTKLLRPIRKNL